MEHIEHEPAAENSPNPILQKLANLQKKIDEYHRQHRGNENGSGLVEAYELLPPDIMEFIATGDDLLGNTDDEKEAIRQLGVDFALGKLNDPGRENDLEKFSHYLREFGNKKE